MNLDDSCSMCCRRRIDNTQLEQRGAGLPEAYPLTGSVRVAIINLSRIGDLPKTKEEIVDCLSTMINLAKDSLEINRALPEKQTASNWCPYTTFCLKNISSRFGQVWRHYFSTIGRVEMNEACLNLVKPRHDK
jgi:ribonucleoside-triphosphate reductase